MIYDILVVGGGASGMMAAITASNSGKNIGIIERNSQFGKKILVTGNGRCNYSNTNQSMDNYYTSDKEFTKSILECFSQKEVTNFFENNGLLTHERDGYLYPMSKQATAIRELLVQLCNEDNITPVFNTKCIDILKNGDVFEVICQNTDSEQKVTFKSRKVILSTGGRTYSKTGSDGSGYSILKKKNVNLSNTLPALVPLYCNDKFFKELKGVRCEGTINLLVDGEQIVSDTGEIQLTDYGVSGIPVFQVSRVASVALNKKKKVEVELDFLPGISKKYFLQLLYSNDFTIEKKLVGLLNNKLVTVILKLSGIKSDLYISEIKKNQIDRLFNNLKALKSEVVKTGDFEQAQVTAGGALLSEVSEGLELKKINGLFITGELLDVDGVCGGYNLQWAWSTGKVAGEAASR